MLLPQATHRHPRHASGAPGHADPHAVQVAGLAIHHVDTGAVIADGQADGHAEPIMLLPGIIATHRYFAKSIAPLAHRFRVVAPDLPGFGRSDKPDAPYSIDWFADVVAALLDAKKIERAHVVGNSLGGQIAMAMALRHPTRIARLVLVAPSGIGTRWLAPARPFIDGIERVVPRLAALRGVSREPAARFMGLVFRHTFPGRPDLAARYLRGYRRAIESEEYPKYLRALLRSVEGCLARPLLDEARRIPHETLILWGRRDRIVPCASASLLQRNMPRARLLVYEGSGHVPMEDDPERFNRDVLAFLGA